MNGKQLKNSILQWAIQGKLVPQDPNDEPASVLLERIRAEKARLVKEGKIKKDKNESIIFRGDDNSHYEKFPDGRVICIDEEIPFQVPQGWEWARMSSLSSVIHYGFTASAGLSGNAKLLRITDIQDGKVQWDDVPFCGIDKKGLCNYQLENDDIVIARTGGTVGKSFVISDISVVAVFASYLIRIKPIPGLYIPYIATYLESPCYWRQLTDATSGTGQPNVNGQSLSNLLVPIPPFDEQKRIIVERNSIYPHLQRYTTAQDRLDALNESLRGSLKKSVLQEAIQGRLIPQDPREEPASVLLEQIREEKRKLLKEGKLKKKDLVDSIIFKGDDNKYYEKIDGTVLDINDEITFDIPESWSWVRLQQVCTYIHRGKSPKYSEVKEFPVIAQKCNQWDGFHIEKAQFIAPESVPSYADENLLRNKDLLWNSTGLGTLGRIGLYPASSNPYGFAVADSHVTVIRTLPEFIRPEFLLMYFSSPTVQSVIEDKASGSTKQKELATETVKLRISAMTTQAFRR